MNVMLVALFAAQVTVQQPARDTTTVTRLVATPAQLTLQSGQTAPLKVTAYDIAGRVVANPILRAGGARGALQLWPDSVKALRAGDYEIVVTAVQLLPPGATPLTAFAANSPVADVHCGVCAGDDELKAAGGRTD